MKKVGGGGKKVAGKSGGKNRFPAKKKLFYSALSRFSPNSLFEIFPKNLAG
jgi:hypothetical protein